MQKLIISYFCILLLVFFKLVGASHACLESKCSDDQGAAIHFPLHISRKHHCGNPGLECNVRYEQQILVKLFVKHIDYKRQEIQVYPPSNCLLLKPVDVTNIDYKRQEIQVYPPSNCLLLKPVDVTNIDYKRQEILVSPPSNLSYSFIRNLTLFSCPTSVARDTYAYQVHCLGDPGSRIYALDSTYQLENLFENLQSCSKMYDVLSGNWEGNGSVLQFKWSKPNCTECEAEGKMCRWKNNGTNSEIECQRVRKPSKENIIFIASFKHRYIYV
ncbi:hypothetical protein DVH24_025642 [Malus domestica]|uniref:RING-type E3 ubiquitin transferase n=1 Tax=Malus domestica TaxID=3750 RepID=A0A498KGK4_MALDO|nr:hypothetical protein DVH24_025642 [Malus domestica]